MICTFVEKKGARDQLNLDHFLLLPTRSLSIDCLFQVVLVNASSWCLHPRLSDSGTLSSEFFFNFNLPSQASFGTRRANSFHGRWCIRDWWRGWNWGVECKCHRARLLLLILITSTWGVRLWNMFARIVLALVNKRTIINWRLVRVKAKGFTKNGSAFQTQRESSNSWSILQYEQEEFKIKVSDKFNYQA